MELGVRTTIVATPTQHHTRTPYTHTSTHSRVYVGTTPDPNEHMRECARDNVVVEHGFAHFET
jgi:hypothetical protein